MKKETAVFELYRNTFPSDAWLERYFGPDQATTPLGMPHTQVELHTWLRNIFDGALRTLPMQQIRLADRQKQGFEKIFVFRDGKLSRAAKEYLEYHGLPIAVLPDAEDRICTEFIAQCEQGAFYEEPWWHWKVHNSSVWIEVRPEANQLGGNRPQRSLSELCKTSKSD